MSLAEQLSGLKKFSTPETPAKAAAARPARPSKRPAASVGHVAAPAAFAALQPKIHLVGFPLRLSIDAVDQLAEWKRTRGIVPGLLVREMVEKGIAELQKGFGEEER